MEILYKTIDEIAITDEVCARYNDLRTQLKGRPYNVNKEELAEVQERRESELLLFLFVDGSIAGMAQVSFICVPHSHAGYVNAVVVDERYRGHGLGTTLMQEAEKSAKARWNSLQHFILTSAPKRNTQGFYVRLGYRMRTKEEGDETIFFIKDL